MSWAQELWERGGVGVGGLQACCRLCSLVAEGWLSHSVRSEVNPLNPLLQGPPVGADMGYPVAPEGKRRAATQNSFAKATL